MLDVTNQNLESLRVKAARYLVEQLGDRAPQSLEQGEVFDEAPLEGEGPTVLFAFDLKPTPGAARSSPDYDPRHYVAVGQTEPNFYPAYDFSPDDAYSFHVGTRFMLGMDMQRVEPDAAPDEAIERMRQFVSNAAPNTQIGRTELSALFRCDDQHFAVFRVNLGGEDWYFCGHDCPPGFHRRTDLSPAVVLRLHLGKVIREAARRAGVADEH